MSEEEKKAIKNVEKFVYSILNGISAYDCKVILNIIEKQQKEIEDLKDIQQQICNEELLEQEYVKENFIRKDKIKAKIEPKLKELDEQINEEWKKYGNSRELQDTEDMYNFLESLLNNENE